MGESGPDYYQALNISSTASQGEVRRAFRVAMRAAHPDVVSGAHERAALINEAGRVLLNPKLRQAYDQSKQNAIWKKRTTAPPVASFTFSKNELDVFVDCSGTRTTRRSRDALTYSWRWGDGSPTEAATSMTASHSYAAPGVFEIVLSVTSSGGSSQSAQILEVNKIPVVASMSLVSSLMRVEVHHIRIEEGTNYELTYAWGDGMTSKSPTHSYAVAGEYVVTTTAKNSEGAGSLTKRVIANLPPLITGLNPTLQELSVEHVEILGDLGFDASFSYSWGDATKASDAPAHTYARAGKYRISITANNSEGSDTFSTYVEVSKPPVIKDFSISCDQLYASIRSVDLGSGENVEYLYDWGDNTTSSWPAHGYATPGRYSVSVTASDLGGNQTKTKEILIERRQSGLPAKSPSKLPVFNGLWIGPRHLAPLARSAMNNDARSLEVVTFLFEKQALNAFTHFQGCEHYGHLNRIWQNFYKDTVSVVDLVSPRDDKFAVDLKPSKIDIASCLLAITDSRELEKLEGQADQVDKAKCRTLGWYRRLADELERPHAELTRLLLITKAGRLASERYDQLERAAAGLLYGNDGIAAKYAAVRKSERIAVTRPLGNTALSGEQVLLPPLPAAQRASDCLGAAVLLMELATKRALSLADACRSASATLKTDADGWARTQIREATPHPQFVEPEPPRPPNRRGWAWSGVAILSAAGIPLSLQGISLVFSTGYASLPDSSLWLVGAYFFALAVAVVLLVVSLKKLSHQVALQKRHRLLMKDYTAQHVKYLHQLSIEKNFLCFIRGGASRRTTYLHSQGLYRQKHMLCTTLNRWQT
ncbi:PKD domain-containing protein [Pseudarthrobacter scleromae]|uniref:J domain-containing protein n=1 Tax=Pseudarthrobacter scleromae TaxID=158897 RepID=UPI00362676D8